MLSWREARSGGRQNDYQNLNVMPVYLDYNATAPIRPEALARMRELLALPLNPSSVHKFGREAKKHLETARKIIANAISAWPNEIIFTASGTEANATVLHGFPGRRILVSAVEHSSVLSILPYRGRSGVSQGEGMIGSAEQVSPHPNGEGIIPVIPSGLIDLSALDAILSGGGPALVSVMLANNETGVIQPICEVAETCKKYGALLHCDAVQGLGKIPVDFGALGVDMMTISGHKCGGPMGAAALVVRRDLAFAPLLTGGGQELGRRAGTENVAAIAGFAVAVEKFDFEHMGKLRGWLDVMEKAISLSLRERVLSAARRVRASQLASPSPSASAFAKASVYKSRHPLPKGEGIILGKLAPRLPNTSCMAMPGVSNEVQVMDFDLKGFALSAGSACSSGRIESSHVLSAMGVPKDVASCAIRISGGWATTRKNIEHFTQIWLETYQRLAAPR